MSAIAPEIVEQISSRISGISLCDRCEISPSECSLVNGAEIYRLCLDCFDRVAGVLIWKTEVGSVIPFRRSVGREVIVEGFAAERLADLMSCADKDEEMSAGAA